MATQEPNVYAGLSVVIGGLMHARPRFFAKVMGELLFWVGEDKMIFGSDYAIWEPKWQVEGFVDWDYPTATSSPTTRASTTAAKKKILGLNAAKLYGIEVPAEFQLPAEAGTPAAQDDAQLRRRGAAGQGVTDAREVLDALGTVRDPELDEPITSLGFVTSCTVSADGVADVRLRLPTYFCAPNFACLMVADAYDAVSAVPGVRAGRDRARGPLRRRRDQPRGGRPGRIRAVLRRPGRDGAGRAARRISCARRCSPPPTGCAGRCSRRDGRRRSSPCCTLGDVPRSPDRERLPRAPAPSSGLPAGDDAPLLVDPLRGEAVGVQALPLHLRRARLTGVEPGGQRRGVPLVAARAIRDRRELARRRTR